MAKREPGFAWGEILEKEPAGAAASAPWVPRELSASLFRDVRQSVAGLVGGALVTEVLKKAMVGVDKH